jgi:hypothetical protein
VTGHQRHTTSNTTTQTPHHSSLKSYRDTWTMTMTITTQQTNLTGTLQRRVGIPQIDTHTRPPPWTSTGVVSLVVDCLMLPMLSFTCNTSHAIHSDISIRQQTQQVPWFLSTFPRIPDFTTIRLLSVLYRGIDGFERVESIGGHFYS